MSLICWCYYWLWYYISLITLRISTPWCCQSRDRDPNPSATATLSPFNRASLPLQICFRPPAVEAYAPLGGGTVVALLFLFEEEKPFSRWGRRNRKQRRGSLLPCFCWRTKNPNEMSGLWPILVSETLKRSLGFGPLFLFWKN